MNARADPHPHPRGQGHDESVGVRVLIVDDHPPFRELARTLLQRAGFTVVGDAGDGAAAVDASRRLRPDVVLVDVQLPDTDGFEVARTLADQDQPPVVVLTSSRDSTAYRRRLASSSARGFIAKADLTGAALSALIG
jgi:DNA-binding NarL/FixJ family response regulator